MLATRLREIEDSPEVRASHLKVVSERLPEAARTPLVLTPQPAKTIFGRALARWREAVQEEPERYRKMLDRGILVGILVVLVVAAYILLLDPA